MRKMPLSQHMSLHSLQVLEEDLHPLFLALSAARAHHISPGSVALELMLVARNHKGKDSAKAFPRATQEGSRARPLVESMHRQQFWRPVLSSRKDGGGGGDVSASTGQQRESP
jgi:hypothetical protein